jgi:hypothetical protein
MSPKPFARRELCGLVQLGEIFAHRPRDVGRIVPVVRRCRVFRAPRHARIGLDYARIRGESLAADQTGAKTGSKHVLEQQAESANISCSCATSDARPPCMWKVRLPIPPPDVEKAGNNATQRGKRHDQRAA